MVDQVAQVALETLRDLLIEEVRFSSGVSSTDQVEEIQRDLTTIHCFLKDADARPDRYNSQTVCNVVAHLKDLATRAEDVFENHAIEVASKIRSGRDLKQKLKRYSTRIMGDWSRSGHNTGKEIESIRSRLADLAKKLESMPSSSADHTKQLLLRQMHAHHEVEEEHFVGMEKDIERLVSLIKDDETRSNRVISVCGMGGLGKTTLARKVSNHPDLQKRFDKHVWVCIGQQFDLKDVLRNILGQIFPEEERSMKNMEPNELVIKLYHVQKKKKCFVVIDDIWETEHWDILKKAFPLADANCKVMLTTRNENIAFEEHVYKLDYLTEDQGWELLQKIALLNFHSQGSMLESEAKQREAIGRKLVQKSGRLPLAISVIGGTLRGKQTLSEWEKVSNNIDTYLKHGEEAKTKDKRVKQVLDMSYTLLPYYLKSCFLCIGCFQEEVEIDTERLYLLWMAEGLISSDDKGSNETLRDVAERYLSELALRYMIQVRYDGPFDSEKFSASYRKFSSCRLHDLMRDLCLSKGHEEGFVRVIDHRQGKNYSVPRNGTINRLAIHLDDSQLVNFFEMEESKSLRSLSIIPEKMVRPFTIDSKHIIFTYLKKMKFLKTLMFEWCVLEDEKLLCVGKLVHLRYLSFFLSAVEELPASVCDMPYLHTLDLRVYFSIRLPNLIHKMKRLRNLFLYQWSVKDDELLILEGLNELETLLLGLEYNRFRIEDLSKLTSLRFLQACFNGNKNVAMVVNQKYQFREADVTFFGCDFSSGEEGAALLKKILMCNLIVKLKTPDVIGFNLPHYQTGMCTNLVDLQFFSSKIEGVDVMEVVGKFPALKSLTLVEEVLGNTNVLICRANDFPQLTTLALWDLSNLEKLEVEQGSMPKLSALHISNCTKLEMIPDGLRFITTLQKLIIHKMPEEFFNRLEVVNGEAGADYHKVSHIPFIQLLKPEAGDD